MFNDINKKSVLPSTVRREFKKSGLEAAVKKIKAVLSPRHRKARLYWAESHKSWTLEDWKRIVWSDETKINRLGSDGRKGV